jgi:hypothetical protein
MLNPIKVTILLTIMLCSVSILIGQGIIWEEDFAVNPGTWTLEGNWSITSGYLRLHYAPIVEPYDMSAISPIISLPDNVRYLHVTQHINYYADAVDEAFEIAVLIDGIPNVLWVWDTVGADWGVMGGSLLTLPLNDFQGQDIQLRFRSWGSSVWYGLEWWRVHHVAIENSHFNDLEAVNISGPVALSVGSTGQYTVTVDNIGMNEQNDYSVKLMKEGNIELASIAGLPIQPDETIDYLFSWTPDETEVTYLYGEIDLIIDENQDNNTTQELLIEAYPPGSGIVNIGSGESLGNTLPASFYFRNSITQTIYMEEEINLTGEITNLAYYSSFTDDLIEKPIKIWMGTTTQNNLTTGWIPVTGQTLVFDGLVNFLEGDQATNIPLQTTFDYETGNIVITVQRPMDTNHYAATNAFYYSVTDQYPNRSRNIQHLLIEYDPYNLSGGTLTDRVPNTRFIFSLGEMGILSGNVYNAVTDEPISGATITITELDREETSNGQGFFSFGNVPIGLYNINAYKGGYYESNTIVTINEGENTQIVFDLLPLPFITVSGQVMDSSNQPEGIVGASVELMGFQEYSTVTTTDGQFIIPEVFSNSTYTILVSYPGYLDYTDTVVVGDSDLELDSIVLEDIPYPPTSVIAAINDQNQVDLSWSISESLVENEQWFYWGPAINPNNNGIGSADGPSQFTTAQRFSVNDIAVLNIAEMYITTLRFWPRVAEATYTLKVWRGGSSDPFDEGILIHSQPANDLVMNQWNEIELTNPVFIDAEQEIWFGYEVNTPSGLPAGVDPGPAIDGFGNLIFWQGSWDTLLNMAPQLDYNWCLQAYAGVMPVNRSVMLSKNEVLKQQTQSFFETRNSLPDFHYNNETSVLSAAIESTNVITRSYNQEKLFYRDSRDILGYYVYRFLLEDQENENLWTLVTTITTPTDTTYTDTSWNTIAPGFYRYALTAVYPNNIESPPAFSNSLERFFNIEVTVNLSTNSGDPVEGAEVTLINNNMNPDDVYTMTAPASGVVVFPSVTSGTYMIRAVLDDFDQYQAFDVEIVENNFIYGIELVETLDPPVNLTYEIDSGNNIMLNWLEPGSGIEQWIHWDSGENHDAIGTGTAAVFTVAVRFTTEDLNNLQVDGLYLTSVRFWPYEGDATYTLGIWTGGSSDPLNSGTLMHTQPVNNVIPQQWNEVSITNPVYIDSANELWFGYQIDTPGGYPAGCDAGPVIDEKGNLMFWNGQWITLLDVNPELDSNWNIQGFTSYSREEENKLLISNENDSEKLRESRVFLGYKILRNDQVLIENLFDLTYTDANVSNGTYVYGISAQYTTGESEIVQTEEITIARTEDNSSSSPFITELKDNYPNPFNPETKISFSLEADSYILLEIYNIKGQRVKVLLNSFIEAGNHSVIWDGQTNQNKIAGSGIYFYRLKAGDYSAVKKMILIK